MFRRILLIAAATVALIAAPAGAQTYPAEVLSGSVTADGDIVVSGEGCPAGATVDYSVTKNGSAFTSGSTTANESGAFSFTVETDGSGDYRVTANCAGQAFVLDQTVAAGGTPGATGPSGSQGAGLPRTGSDSSIPFAQLGVVLVMLGGVAVYAAKRRRADNTFA